jgi:polyisoprenoid-binding protein YceI
MTRRTKLSIIGLGAAVLLAACGRGPTERSFVSDGLELSAGQSRIWFIGIKNDAVAVPGYFAMLRGSLSLREKKAWIEASVGSLDTGDTQRDMNIRTHLFETEEFPRARLTVEEFSGPDSLPEIGGVVDGVAIGTLEIHKSRVDLRVPVRITREGTRRVRVTTTQPFILTADELGLSNQLAKLKMVCGHISISSAVPVEIDLVFEGSGT